MKVSKEVFRVKSLSKEFQTSCLSPAWKAGGEQAEVQVHVQHQVQVQVHVKVQIHILTAAPGFRLDPLNNTQILRAFMENMIVTVHYLSKKTAIKINCINKKRMTPIVKGATGI